jgi:hypothetical protein
MIVKQDYSLDKKILSSRYMLISTTPRMVVCNNGIFQVALMPFYQTILSIEYGGVSKNVVYRIPMYAPQSVPLNEKNDQT